MQRSDSEVSAEMTSSKEDIAKQKKIEALLEIVTKAAKKNLISINIGRGLYNHESITTLVNYFTNSKYTNNLNYLGSQTVGVYYEGTEKDEVKLVKSPISERKNNYAVLVARESEIYGKKLVEFRDVLTKFKNSPRFNSDSAACQAIDDLYNAILALPDVDDCLKNIKTIIAETKEKEKREENKVNSNSIKLSLKDFDNDFCNEIRKPIPQDSTPAIMRSDSSVSFMINKGSPLLSKKPVSGSPSIQKKPSDSPSLSRSIGNKIAKSFSFNKSPSLTNFQVELFQPPVRGSMDPEAAKEMKEHQDVSKDDNSSPKKQM